MLEKLRELLGKHPAASKPREEEAGPGSVVVEHIPRPEQALPEPPRVARIPDSCKGLSYGDLTLLEADGGLSGEQLDYLNSKGGPTDKRGQYGVSQLMRATKRSKR